MFLKCSDNNNRSSTVLSEVTATADFHSLPSQIRIDLGGENVEVWHYMVEQHNSRRAVITGASTLNECIEYLWQDVYRCVGVLFMKHFITLKTEEPLIH